VTDISQQGLAGMVTNFYGIPLVQLSNHLPPHFEPPNTQQISTPYSGSIILFDWPSFFEIDKKHPKLSYNNAKENARKTAKYSMGALSTLIDTINKSGKKVDIVCHSMGNYVFQQGAETGKITKGSISTCHLNAAAISSDSFVSGSTFTNADGIIQSLETADAVKVLWSPKDDALPAAELIDPWGKLFPSGPGELGRFGPTNGLENVSNKDCSTIGVEKPIGGGAGNIHTSYYYLQETLDLMIAKMS
jgi:hypothetical protein